MLPLMVKEADLNRVNVPEDYEVLDATALGRRLGFKRDTVLAYLSRRNFRRIPRPNLQLAMVSTALSLARALPVCPTVIG
jgi:hypothetical protein